MDPEGIREVFLAECGAAADYGTRRALRSLPFPVRFQESFFYGVHLPLTRKLPKRLDTVMAQRTGLHAYDAIVLTDIDPVIFDADDLWNLLAYVEGGGGLLLMGGPNSFNKAQRGWGPFREALPADIDFQPQKKTKLWNTEFKPEPEPTAVPLVPGSPHPSSLGIDRDLGKVVRFHRLFPKPASSVIASAAGEPIMVAWTFGRGRIVMGASYPSDHPECTFRKPAWDDFLRQMLTWLMKRDSDLAVDSWEPGPVSLRAGDEWTCRMTIAGNAPGSIKSTATMRMADAGWLAAGREPQYGHAQTEDLQVNGNELIFRFKPPQPGLWQIRLDVSGAQWANTRIATVSVHSTSNLRISSRNGEYVTAQGRTLPLTIMSSGPAAGTLRVVDSRGSEVMRKDGVKPGDIDITIPHLEPGDYNVVLDAGGDSAQFRFAVVEPVRRIGFSVVASGAWGPTEERVRWWFDYFRKRGFNAFATSAAPVSIPEDSSPLFRDAPFARYLVQREGLDLWGDGFHASNLSTHAHYGDEGIKPTRPCVWTKEYGTDLRKRLEALFACTSFPRMTSLEILDEPHIMRANVCRCDECLSRFRKRFGHEMPTWDEALSSRDHRTANYFEWLIDYGAEAFRQGYTTWKSFGKGPNLHHVLCGIGSGQISARHAIAEDLPWSQHADFLEFDCYNYMYPSWRCAIALRWNHFHYLAGHFRFLTRRNKQRMGFWIQVTDREVPVAPYDPLRAPSETLYTAIGAGAKSFHLMSKGSFSTTQNCREEKFDTFAEDIRKIQKVAPLLDIAERQQSRAAMIFPFHDRLYRQPAHYLPEGYKGLGFYGAEQRPVDTVWPYHMASINVAELVFRAFGEVDVVDQRALRDNALSGYGAFVLAGTDYMDESDAKAIRSFVEKGGALVCDHVPSHSLSGKALRILDPLFRASPEPFYRDVSVARDAFGDGATLLFSHDLQDLYSTSVEQNNSQLRYRIKDTIRAFLHGHGLRPQVRSNNHDIEANLLTTPDTLVLVAVNHAETRQRARLQVFSPTVPATCAFDLVTMAPIPLLSFDEGIAIDVDLEEREGIIVGLYPAAPTGIGLRATRTRVSTGTPLAFDIELLDDSGRRPRGNHIVDVEVLNPDGQQMRPWTGNYCATNGFLSIAEPLAINARTGTWTISAFDRFTTRLAKATIQVTSPK